MQQLAALQKQQLANTAEIENGKKQLESLVKKAVDRQSQMSGKEMAKLLEPDVQASFKSSMQLVKQFKKQSIPTNEFVKQFIKSKAAFYEGQCRQEILENS